MTTAYVTIRHRCQWCRKSYAKRADAVRHEARCHHDPKQRACSTCRHFTRGGNVQTGYAGIICENDCAKNAFRWIGVLFPADATHGHYEDFKRFCCEWESKA